MKFADAGFDWPGASGGADVRRELLTTRIYLERAFAGARPCAGSDLYRREEITASLADDRAAIEGSIAEPLFLPGVSMPIMPQASVDVPRFTGAIPLALLNVLRSTRKA